MQAWSAVPARSRLRPSSLICTVLCTSSYIHPSSPIAPSTSINGRRPEPFILTSPFTSPKTFLPPAGKAIRPARLGRSGDTAVTREGRWYFQLPAHRPIFIIHRNLCSGPVCGRLGVTASPHLEATWPSVQFRQLTKLWLYQGFVNRTERIRVTGERWQATLTRPYRPHSPREGPHQRCLRPVTERNRQDHLL